jgi:hypothetical protein
MSMKKLTAVLAAAALLAIAVASPALAGYRYKHSGYYGHGGNYYNYRPYYRYGYGRHYGYRRHGYGYSGFYGHGDAAVVVGVLAGAVVLGALLSQPRPVYASPVYARPAPVRAAVFRSPSGAALGNCVETLGTGTWNGRPARFAGTRCTDAAGQAYVIDDSVRFLMYLN